MASRFGSARAFLEKKSAEAAERNSVDALLKKAQAAELGYDIVDTPGRFGGLFGGGQTIVQRPDFVSSKALEREKLSLGVNKLKREEEDSKLVREKLFGGGASTPSGKGQSGITPQPKSFKFGGQTFGNPDYQLQQQDLRLKSKPEVLKRAGSLRGEFTKSPYVEKFQDMRGYNASIDAALADSMNRPNESKAISDQALVVMFNKMLDPTSVVREAEFARTPEGLSLLNRLQGYSQKVAQGGVGITDAERQDISRVAKRLLNETGALYNKELDRFGNLAKSYEIDDPALVTGGYERFTPAQLEQGGGEVPAWAIGEEDFYALAKQNGYSDEEIMRKLGV